MLRGAAWVGVSTLALMAAPALAAQSSPAAAQTEKVSGSHSVTGGSSASGSDLPDLPPAPPAKASTIFGGAIRQIDPVRDQFMLHVYGQHPMKVLFDERTQVYRDGVKIPLHDLAPADHASVQTALDGTGIFAISIHILSSIPQGEYRGRVLYFDDSKGELRLDASPSPRPFTVRVPANCNIVRKGQSEFTSEGSGRYDLRRGALVDVTFAAGKGVVGVATQIVVLAVPGASFVFTGNIADLDEGAGTLVIVDPRDDKSYRVSFVPSAIPGSQNLHVGQRVRMTANYDGVTYTATDITPY